MRFDTLEDWLNWQETLNPAEIDLGLERVEKVLHDAGLATQFACPLITVGGTNGKGSVVAMLESMARAAGLTVCSYTSPHLFVYNERIKVNTVPVSNNDLCAAFEYIDQARGHLQLTYFEFGTLAAIKLFFDQKPDLVILEVGLGGRLDASNIMDADVSVITSIAIDHVDWLGDNRDAIAYEKAGIFRQGKPVICGEQDAPASMLAYAKKLHCEFLQSGRDYTVQSCSASTNWTLNSVYGALAGLSAPALQGDFQYLNAATAIMALLTLQDKQRLPLTQHSGLNSRVLSTALTQVNLPGRYQKVSRKPAVYVDVAHNLQAAQALASQLKATAQVAGNAKVWAVVAMLSDKDVAAVIDSVRSEIDYWCFAGLDDSPRGLSAEALIEKLPETFLKATKPANPCKILPTNACMEVSVQQACKWVLSKAKASDRIIIFGSFYTVTQAMQHFSHTAHIK